MALQSKLFTPTDNPLGLKPWRVRRPILAVCDEWSVLKNFVRDREHRMEVTAGIMLEDDEVLHGFHVSRQLADMDPRTRCILWRGHTAEMHEAAVRRAYSEPTGRTRRTPGRGRPDCAAPLPCGRRHGWTLPWRA